MEDSNKITTFAWLVAMITNYALSPLSANEFEIEYDEHFVNSFAEGICDRDCDILQFTTYNLPENADFPKALDRWLEVTPPIVSFMHVEPTNNLARLRLQPC